MDASDRCPHGLFRQVLLVFIPALLLISPHQASSDSEGAPHALMPARFQGLGTLDGAAIFSRVFAVSRDGSTVIGESFTDRRHDEGFVWRESEGMVGLGTRDGPGELRRPWALSADGAVIVGVSASKSGRDYEAFRWKSATGVRDLGFLPGVHNSVARGVSADGAVVVGYSGDDFDRCQPFRWTASEGMTALGGATEAAGLTRCIAISADARVIAGLTTAGQLWCWTPDRGVERFELPPDAHGRAYTGPFITDDGGVILGAAGDNVYRWTRQDGAQLLCDPAGDPVVMRPRAINADASMVVGSVGTPGRAVLWGGTTDCRHGGLSRRIGDRRRRHQPAR